MTGVTGVTPVTRRTSPTRSRTTLAHSPSSTPCRSASPSVGSRTPEGISRDRHRRHDGSRLRRRSLRALAGRLEGSLWRSGHQFRRTSSHNELVRCYSMFRLPAVQDTGWLVTHVNGNRGVKGLLETGLYRRFRDAESDLMLQLTPFVLLDLLPLPLFLLLPLALPSSDLAFTSSCCWFLIWITDCLSPVASSSSRAFRLYPRSRSSSSFSAPVVRDHPLYALEVEGGWSRIRRRSRRKRERPANPHRWAGARVRWRFGPAIKRQRKDAAPDAHLDAD
jgi:hypothetical protein